jgi:ABC-type sugar transport system ATPase subunit
MAAAAPVPAALAARGAPPLIDVRNIVKQFGSVIALSGVSMAVEAARSTACWATTGPASRR